LNQSAPIQRHYRGLVDRIAYAIAIGGGAGLSPFAPGTCGALEGVAVYFASAYFATGVVTLTHSEFVVFLVALNLVVFSVGVWASGLVCEISGIKDPQKVVIDEVSGQLIALVPAALSPGVVPVIAAFALFRLFDIFKPYPIRRLESLPGGLGVMADDALAGVYAGVLVWIGRLLHLF
jgi:phosphatidylglycerophosphatase A